MHPFCLVLKELYSVLVCKCISYGCLKSSVDATSYLEFLEVLEKKVDQDWDSISLSLNEIRRSLLSREGCLINMTAEGKNLANSEKYVNKFLDLLPSTASVDASSWNARLSPINEAIVIPTQVLQISFLQPCSAF